MFPYRVKYTESKSDIQNNDLLYKAHQQCQNTFEHLETFGKTRNQSIKHKVLFCYMYNFHNSMFVFFVILRFVVILYILYYTCTSLTRVDLAT